jgi:hypothetical protein
MTATTNDIVNIINSLSDEFPRYTFSISCKSNLEPKLDKIGEYHVLHKWYAETNFVIILPKGSTINHKIYGSSRISIEEAVQDLKENIECYQKTIYSGFEHWGGGMFRSKK